MLSKSMVEVLSQKAQRAGRGLDLTQAPPHGAANPRGGPNHSSIYRVQVAGKVRCHA
jgi:hypothetical protein